MNKLTLKESISINAPASRVWQALTDPSLIKEYFFGTQAISDFKKGSKLIYRGEWEGHTYEDKGTILESEENRLLKHDYWSSMSGLPDVPESYATLTYVLDPLENKTVLSVTQDGLHSEEQLEHSRQNWQAVLGKMKELLESR